MTTTSTAIVVYDPQLAGPEHIALAGFLGGYEGSPVTPMRWIFVSSPPSAMSATWVSSRSVEATSRPTAGSWKLEVGQRPPSVADCAP